MHIWTVLNKHTSFVMKPGEAAVRFRVQVAAEDAHAHAGLVVGLVGILFGIFVPRFRGYSVVVFAPWMHIWIFILLNVHSCY